MKYISYSLWGDSRLYCENAIINVELAKKHYPDWTCRFYISKNCPALPIIQKMDCQTIVMDSAEGVYRKDDKWVYNTSLANMFWRYYILDELKEEDVVLFRDCDSHLSQRESIPVNMWLASKHACIRFIENEAQGISFLMGGLWGIKYGYLQGIEESISEWVEIYKTFNHPWAFVDLTYHNQILAPLLYDKIMSFGYKQEYSLPECKEENRIGHVMNSEWRDEIFDPLKYERENEQ